MTSYANLSCEPGLSFPTLVDILQWRARHQTDRVAYTFLSPELAPTSMTYGQLDRQSRAVASWLQSKRMEGQRILLLYPSSLEYLAAFFGCLYAGAVAVPSYPPEPAKLSKTMARLANIMNDAQVATILTSSAILAQVESLSAQGINMGSWPWLATDTLADSLAESWKKPALSPETLAFLQYTSGSTGTPKGVMLTHGNLLYNQQMIQIAFQHTEKSVVVGWLPLYHDMGLIGNVLQPLYIGFPCFLMAPFSFLQSPFRWLEAISQYKATTSGAPNFAYHLCVRRITPQQRATLDLSSWDLAFNGAEPIRQQTLEQFAATFAPCGFRREVFYPCYGLAEAALIVSGGQKNRAPFYQTVDSEALQQNRVVFAPPATRKSQTFVSCGRPFLDQTVLIVNPQTRMICPREEVGEIWVRGDSISSGYWQRPQENEEIFQGRLLPSGDGPFLRTGDLGFIWDGELFITGRLKDLIIIRGRNHYPQDIEWTVERSHPALRMGCGAAFSIEPDNEERLIVIQEVDTRQNPNWQEVFGAIREAVVDTHDLRTHGVVLIQPGTIPKTSSGKIQRRACRAKFLDGTLDIVQKSTPFLPDLDHGNSRPATENSPGQKSRHDVVTQ